jgi:hypothetical protein
MICQSCCFLNRKITKTEKCAFNKKCLEWRGKSRFFIFRVVCCTNALLTSVTTETILWRQISDLSCKSFDPKSQNFCVFKRLARWGPLHFGRHWTYHFFYILSYHIICQKNDIISFISYCQKNDMIEYHISFSYHFKKNWS